MDALAWRRTTILAGILAFYVLLTLLEHRLGPLVLAAAALRSNLLCDTARVLGGNLRRYARGVAA